MQVMDTVDTIKHHTKRIKKFSNDPLTNFIVQVEQEHIDKLQNANLEKLLQLARKRGIRYLCIADGEICGCEDIDYNGWPAIWDIVRAMGFPGSCGNGNQYQVFDAGIAFPTSSIGGWDLVENRKLTTDETNSMKFNRVVSRKWV